jgi:phosphonate C-P lyase system protein PhnG
LSLYFCMMHYSEIIAEAHTDALREIADLIVNRMEVRVLKPPVPGMVMVRHSDPLENTLFLLGEAFVTECEVEVEGLLGYGCVLGSGEERALCGALVDAVLGASTSADGASADRTPSPGGHMMTAEVEHLLEAERLRIEARWEAESRAVASTRVSFEVR